MDDTFPDKPFPSQDDTHQQGTSAKPDPSELRQLKELTRQLTQELIMLRDHQAGMESTLRALQLELSVQPRKRNRANRNTPQTIIHDIPGLKDNHKDAPMIVYTNNAEEPESSWLLTAALIIAIPIISWFSWNAYTNMNDLQKKLSSMDSAQHDQLQKPPVK